MIRIGACLFIALLAATGMTVARGTPSTPPTTSLGEVFDMAQSTPDYRSAAAELDVSQARMREAHGRLLPQLSLTASANGNRRSYNTHDPYTDTTRDRYHAHSYQLSLTQPLWRPENTASLHQAEDSERQAKYKLADAEQKLYAKLSDAWFELMRARDDVEFTAAQRDALQAEAKMAQRAARLGVQGEPKAADAEAKYQEASADAASAELDRETKLAHLEQLIGPADDLIQPYLRDDATLPDLVGDDLDAWLNQIDTHCPALRAANQAIAAADDEIRKQRAGHKPTLDLVARYGTNDQSVGNFPGQAGYGIRTLTVGVELNVPLYSGGTQSAKVAEALATRDKALADRDAARRQAILDIKTAYFQWQAGRAKARGAAIGMKAARLAWQAARRGQHHGLKTHEDVLKAQQQWVEARRNMRRGRYQQIVAFVKLRATLGELDTLDVDELDSLFTARNTNAFENGLAMKSTAKPGRTP